MKQIFKSLGLCCLAICLLLGGFLAYQNTGIVYGATTGNTYEYSANIVENYDTTFLNGIDSVESVKFDYYTYIHYSFTNAQTVNGCLYSYRSISSYTSNTRIIGFKYNIQNYIDYFANTNTLNFMLYGNFTIKQETFKTPAVNGNPTMYRYSFTGTCTDFYITDFFLSINNNIFQFAAIDYKAKPRSFVCSDDNLSDYLDFDSSTNYTYDLSSVFSFLSDLSYQRYNLLKSMQIDGTFDTGAFYYAVPTVQLWTQDSKGNNYYSNFSTKPIDANVAPYGDLYPYFYLSFDHYSDNFYLTSGKYTVDSKIYITNFEVTVNRPVERLENALVLYNYDYDCGIKSINHIEYALSKNGDRYIAKYDGKLPNSRFIGIVSEDLQNRIYDEYIYIYLTFDNNTVDMSKTGSFALGFDFNFAKYYEPFVIDTIDIGNYNLPILKKPRDWYDFGGWIMYAFIYVLFYNPVVATFAPYLTHFMALIYNSLTFVTGFSIGTVLTGLLGFSILLGFFSSFVPSKPVPKLFDKVSSSTTNVIVKGADKYKQSSIEKAKHNEYKRKLKEQHSINHLDK